MKVLRAMTRREARNDPAAFMQQVLNKQRAAKKSAWARDYPHTGMTQRTLDKFRQMGAV